MVNLGHEVDPLGSPLAEIAPNAQELTFLKSCSHLEYKAAFIRCQNERALCS